MSNFDLKKIQSILKETEFDGWLFFDFRGSNEVAHTILDISPKAHLTRRLYYFIPKSGEPVKILNGIEAFHLDHLPGKKLTYSSHESLHKHIKEALKDAKVIAMEYSPLNANPYVAKVDAGTIELIKSFGKEIKGSGDLISMFAARWTKQQYEENKPVADALYDIVGLAFNFIAKNIKEGSKLNEYDVQQFIMKEFDKRGYETDSPPIVGVNENAANPHYEPGKDQNKPINKGDFVLIDLWARQQKPDAVWADITWVGYVGESVPEKYTKVANVVFQARDKAFNLVNERFTQGKEVRGYEVDAVTRKHISDAGYGDYFIHRTGHSIDTEVHGSGAHMDNFETKDERLILTSTSFSIEPGIYLTGDFGVRSEIDVYITEDGKVLATGKERQKEVVAIL